MDALKHKIGPLAAWQWLAILAAAVIAYELYRRSSSSSTSSAASQSNQVDPNSPMGLTYAQEQADIAQGIDPNTGVSYADEQAAQDAAQNAALGASGGGGSGSGGASSGDTGTTTTLDSASQAELTGLDSDVQILTSDLQTAQANQGDYTGAGLTDQSQAAYPTFAQELGDVAAGATGLKALEQALAPTPATVRKQPALTVRGAKRLPSGPTRPKAPKGYTVRGLGNGAWEAVPVIQHKVQPRPSKPKAEPVSHHPAPPRRVSGKKH